MQTFNSGSRSTFLAHTRCTGTAQHWWGRKTCCGSWKCSPDLFKFFSGHQKHRVFRKRYWIPDKAVPLVTPESYYWNNQTSNTQDYLLCCWNSVFLPWPWITFLNATLCSLILVGARPGGRGNLTLLCHFVERKKCPTFSPSLRLSRLFNWDTN